MEDLVTCQAPRAKHACIPECVFSKSRRSATAFRGIPSFQLHLRNTSRHSVQRQICSSWNTRAKAPGDAATYQQSLNHAKNEREVQQSVKSVQSICNHPASMLVKYGGYALKEICQTYQQASANSSVWQALDFWNHCFKPFIDDDLLGFHMDKSSRGSCNIKGGLEEDKMEISLSSLKFGPASYSLDDIHIKPQESPQIIQEPKNQSQTISSLCSCLFKKFLLLPYLVILCFNTSPTLAGQTPISPFHEKSLRFDGTSSKQSDLIVSLNSQLNDAKFESQAKSGSHNRILLINMLSSSNEYAPSKPTNIFSMAENAVLCKETYGIFPCSVSLGGNLFLMLVYGYVLLNAAKLISEGSELLLEVMNPGLIGGLLLPILGALPDALLVFFSGSNGTIEEAKQEVMIGVGVLAGSTTTILTIAWAGSLIVGRCDLSGPDGTAQDITLTRGFDLFKTGVTTDEQTRWGAWIMMSSTLPLICAQTPLLDGHPTEGPEAALAGAVVAFFCLLTYCLYQVTSPWLQQKQIEEARLQLLRLSALQGITSFNIKSLFPATLLQEEAIGPSQGLVKEVFDYFDKNKDGKIQEEELQGLIVGLNLQKKRYIPAKEQVETWLKEFDSDADGMLTENEFLSGVQKWAHRVMEERDYPKAENINKCFKGNDPDFWASKFEEAVKVVQLLESEMGDSKTGSEEAVESPILNSSELYKRAVACLASGAALAALFADPLIDSIQGVSTASSIPPFFVAFVAVPIASNASELFSSIMFAKRQRKRNISLSFSQIYGSVTMNNTLCLGIFLGIIYARGLTWDFSSEVTVILLNVLCVGILGVSRTTFPLWYSIPVLSLYPLSIGGVLFLDKVLGWH